MITGDNWMMRAMLNLAIPILKFQATMLKKAEKEKKRRNTEREAWSSVNSGSCNGSDKL